MLNGGEFVNLWRDGNFKSASGVVNTGFFVVNNGTFSTATNNSFTINSDSVFFEEFVEFLRGSNMQVNGDVMVLEADMIGGSTGSILLLNSNSVGLILCYFIIIVIFLYFDISY